MDWKNIKMVRCDWRCCIGILGSIKRGSKVTDIKNLSLGEKQRLFVSMVGDLIRFAYSIGLELSLGDGYRDPRLFGQVGEEKGYGRSGSNHKLRLAIDLNLFKDGKYLTKTEDHRPIGEYWESLGGSWGGRFNDGNHYSIEHKGRR